MDSSTPRIPVHHQLPELAQTHVHRVSDAMNHLFVSTSLSRSTINSVCRYITPVPSPTLLPISCACKAQEESSFCKIPSQLLKNEPSLFQSCGCQSLKCQRKPAKQRVFFSRSIFLLMYPKGNLCWLALREILIIQSCWVTVPGFVFLCLCGPIFRGVWRSRVSGAPGTSAVGCTSLVSLISEAASSASLQTWWRTFWKNQHSSCDSWCQHSHPQSVASLRNDRRRWRTYRTKPCLTSKTDHTVAKKEDYRK